MRAGPLASQGLEKVARPVESLGQSWTGVAGAGGVALGAGALAEAGAEGAAEALALGAVAVFVSSLEQPQTVNRAVSDTVVTIVDFPIWRFARGSRTAARGAERPRYRIAFERIKRVRAAPALA